MEERASSAHFERICLHEGAAARDFPAASTTLVLGTNHYGSPGIPVSESGSRLASPLFPMHTLPEWHSAFFQENLRRVYLQIYRMVGNVSDAQDLTQEVFVKVLQRTNQLEQGDRAVPWLSRIAFNTTIDFLRRRSRVQLTDLDHLPDYFMVSPGENPEEHCVRNELHQWLETGLRHLSERERSALLLRDVDELPVEEVAAHLGCSKATVRSHIANARIKLKKKMGSSTGHSQRRPAPALKGFSSPHMNL